MATFKASIIDKDLGMEEAIAWWKELEDKEVVAGILEKDAFTLASPTEANPRPEITLITKAATHEFGSYGKPKGGRTPKRAPIHKGTTLAKPVLLRTLEKGMKSITSQPLLLGVLGKKLVTGFRKAIDMMSRPPLHHKTIDNKGHTRMLRDSNQLYNAYDSEVRDRRGS